MALDENFAHKAADPEECQWQDDLNDFRRHASSLMARGESDHIV